MKSCFFFVLIVFLATTTMAATTAHQAKVMADSAASTLATDRQLKVLSTAGEPASPGSFDFWLFYYYSPTLDTAIQVTVYGSIAMPQLSTVNNLEIMPTVPNNFINSPIPYNNALTNGGSAFLNAHPNATMAMIISVHPSLSQQNAWYVSYADAPDQLTIVLDILTGEFMSATDVAENERPLPQQFSIEPCYPNPFNATTTLRFELSQPRDVTLAIYDSNGRWVTSLVQGSKQAGRYAVQWNATGMATGVYFAKLQVGQEIQIQRIVLLK